MITTMKAMVSKDANAKPVITSVNIPQISENDVLVKVYAASINPVDTGYKMLHRFFKIPTHYPLILGNDFSGIITEVGKNVKEFQKGDKVYGRVSHDRTGTFAEYLSVEANAVALAPTNISLTEAAAVPLVGLTAYQALFDLIKIKPDEKIFINAGTGGVGSMAIQLAHNRGAYVATTISKRNQKLVTDLGADEIIDYHSTDFSSVLNDFNAVFDTHGGKDTAKGLQILKNGGRETTIAGMPPRSMAVEKHLGILRQFAFGLVSRSLVSVARQKNIDYQFMLMKSNGQQLAELTQLIDDGKLRPIIDRTYPFDNIFDGIDYAKKGHSIGKVVIKIVD